MACTAVHEDDNPEYSILKARIAKRLQTEGATDADIQAMDLVGLTKVPLPSAYQQSVYFFRQQCNAR